MCKPDALYGATARVPGDRAASLLLALSHHCGATVALPRAADLAGNRAARQIRERAATEPSFTGTIRDAAGCAMSLQATAERMSGTGCVPTVAAVTAALRGLGYGIEHVAEHCCTEHDVDAIYAEQTAGDYPAIRAELLDYLAGQPIRVYWLRGEQQPCALQYWKTYVRHVLQTGRRIEGEYQLRNLVHVCEGPDASYLARTLRPDAP